MNKTRFAVSDRLRLLSGYELYLAVAGTVCALFLALENSGIQESVVDTFIHTRNLSLHVLVYIFCALPYAAAFCEDLENKYIYYTVNRGSLRNYTVSKVAHIYLASVVTMVAGVYIYCLIVRTQVPWAMTSDVYYDIAAEGGYSSLFLQSRYLLYCLIYALNLGLLAGTLSVAASYISLYIQSRIIVLTVPALLTLICYEIADTSIFTVASFEPIYNPFESDLLSQLFIFAMSIIPVAILTVLIYRRLQKKF